IGEQPPWKPGRPSPVLALIGPISRHMAPGSMRFLPRCPNTVDRRPCRRLTALDAAPGDFVPGPGLIVFTRSLTLPQDRMPAIARQSKNKRALGGTAMSGLCLQPLSPSPLGTGLAIRRCDTGTPSTPSAKPEA